MNVAAIKLVSWNPLVNVKVIACRIVRIARLNMEIARCGYALQFYDGSVICNLNTKDIKNSYRQKILEVISHLPERKVLSVMVK